MGSEQAELVVDVGNTRMKLALFQGGRPVRCAAVPHQDREAVEGLLAGTRPMRIAWGSVGKKQEAFRAWLEGLAPVTEILPGGPSPVASRYQAPHSLGVDRMANAVGAALLFPHRAVLAIDLGSCITMDLVDPLAVHQGGSISPGLAMRARAMHTYSAALPEAVPSEDPPVLGLDTAGSLAAGIHHGIVAELRQAMAFHRQQWPDLAVVLTGGDALRFVKALKSGIFAHPLLTLLGLHALLHHYPHGGARPRP
jgi:type III pantothenate kinase